MFLGFQAEVSNWNEEKTEFSLILPENPFADFVELPRMYKPHLNYCNILCGMIRGSLKTVNLKMRF
jgi:hypothetical protein